MNTNKKFVITINRELGSGGRTVGQKLSEKLGVTFYDKALIKALTEKYKLSVEEIEQMKGRSHSWWADFKRTFTIGAGMSSSQQNYKIRLTDMPDVLTTEDMFETEQEILKGIAVDESCVVAGRSGFYVFREHPNHLSILIQAPMDSRVERVASKQNMTREEAQRVIAQVDKMRENYIQKYAHTSRYDTRNYDLVINMKGLTEDDAVDIIMEYLKRTNK